PSAVCTPSACGRFFVAVPCHSPSSGIIFPSAVNIGGAVTSSSPDDHFTAGPHCRVTDSGGRRVGGAGGCPTVSAGIVSSAGVRLTAIDVPSPDDHFTAGPDCCVTDSGRGRIGGAGGCPTVLAGVIPSAGVEQGRALTTTPDNHFAAGPDCRVTDSAKRGISGGRSRPCIISARRLTRVCNFRQSVGNPP